MTLSVQGISIQGISLALGDDEQGALVLKDGKLIALVCQLSRLHGSRAGRWHVEWAADAIGAVFEDYPDLDSVCAMLEHRLLRNAVKLCAA